MRHTYPRAAYGARTTQIHAKLARLRQLADENFGHDPDAVVDGRRRGVEFSMDSDRPGILIRKQLMELLAAHGEAEVHGLHRTTAWAQAAGGTGQGFDSPVPDSVTSPRSAPTQSGNPG